MLQVCIINIGYSHSQISDLYKVKSLAMIKGYQEDSGWLSTFRIHHCTSAVKRIFLSQRRDGGEAMNQARITACMDDTASSRTLVQVD